MKKAQAAMEFLMTYGWAILVVLVAIGALAYFGVLSPDKMLPEKCVISTGSGLFCDKYQVSTNGINLRLKNTLAEAINLTFVGAGSSCVNTTNTQVAADSEVTLFLPCTLTSGKFNEDLNITFVDEDLFQKKTTGTLVSRVV